MGLTSFGWGQFFSEKGNLKEFKPIQQQRQLIMTSKFLKQKKIGFIGCGNIAKAIIAALLKSQDVLPEQIWIANRSEGKLKKTANQFSINYFLNNEDIVNHCDIIFLAIKPQDLTEAIEPISSAFSPHQIVISLIPGKNLANLQKLIPKTPFIVRAMPSTAAHIQKSAVGYCYTHASEQHQNTITDLLSPLGDIFKINETEFAAFTVGASSGIGFLFEIMIYWQQWLEEQGLSSEIARAVTVQTFKGASLLADFKSEKSLNELRDQVTSQKGVTAAGLKSMTELEIERALRISFEKAVLRNNDLDKGL